MCRRFDCLIMSAMAWPCAISVPQGFSSSTGRPRRGGRFHQGHTPFRRNAKINGVNVGIRNHFNAVRIGFRAQTAGPFRQSDIGSGQFARQIVRNGGNVDAVNLSDGPAYHKPRCIPTIPNQISVALAIKRFLFHNCKLNCYCLCIF